MPHILLHSFSSSLFSEGGTLSFWDAVFCTVGTYLGAEALSSDVLAEAPAVFEVAVSPVVLMGVPTALDGDAAPAVFYVLKNYLELTSNSLLEPLIFILSFNADQIHATFAAIVPSVEPIPVGRTN